MVKRGSSNLDPMVLPLKLAPLVLASEAGPGPKTPKFNLLCGKLSRAVAICLCLAFSKVYMIDETPFLNHVFSMLSQTLILSC